MLNNKSNRIQNISKPLKLLFIPYIQSPQNCRPPHIEKPPDGRPTNLYSMSVAEQLQTQYRQISKVFFPKQETVYNQLSQDNIVYTYHNVIKNRNIQIWNAQGIQIQSNVMRFALKNVDIAIVARFIASTKDKLNSKGKSPDKSKNDLPFLLQAQVHQHKTQPNKPINVHKSQPSGAPQVNPKSKPFYEQSAGNIYIKSIQMPLIYQQSYRSTRSKGNKSDISGNDTSFYNRKSVETNGRNKRTSISDTGQNKDNLEQIQIYSNQELTSIIRRSNKNCIICYIQVYMDPIHKKSLSEPNSGVIISNLYSGYQLNTTDTTPSSEKEKLYMITASKNMNNYQQRQGYNNMKNQYKLINQVIEEVTNSNKIIKKNFNENIGYNTDIRQIDSRANDNRDIRDNRQIDTRATVKNQQGLFKKFFGSCCFQKSRPVSFRPNNGVHNQSINSNPNMVPPPVLYKHNSYNHNRDGEIEYEIGTMNRPATQNIIQEGNWGSILHKNHSNNSTNANSNKFDNVMIGTNENQRFKYISKIYKQGKT